MYDWKVKLIHDITRCLLLNDSTLCDRWNLTCEEKLQALELCLNPTLFTFQGRPYRQTDGIAMGSPVSPIVANIFMSNFEEKILSTYTPSPKVWCRFVDDTFVILKQSETKTFFEFLNNQCSFVKFTVELENSNGILCFLDSKITRSSNGMLNSSVFKKPTHSDRYLDFHSAHPLYVKSNVVENLFSRIERIVTSEEDEIKERAVVLDTVDLRRITKNFELV